MLEIEWQASGIFAMTAKKSEALLKQATTVCLERSLFEWATGRGHTATRLADRFAPSAFNVYGFTRRHSAYTRRQMRADGQVRPYYSPRLLNVSGLVTAAARLNARALLQAAARIQRNEHMAKLIVRPGGFTLQARGGGRRVRVKISYPGARALNAGGAKNEIYRRELADWTAGNRRDLDAVMGRAREVFSQEFANGLIKYKKRRVGRRRAA